MIDAFDLCRKSIVVVSGSSLHLSVIFFFPVNSPIRDFLPKIFLIKKYWKPFFLYSFIEHFLPNNVEYIVNYLILYLSFS